MSTTGILLYIFLFLICLLLSAFFSSSETAYISLQKVRLQRMVDEKVPGANRVARLLESPEKLLSTVLLGNNLVNTAAAALGTGLAISLLGPSGLIVATVAVTMLLLVFGETGPKTFATQHAERISLMYAGLLEFVGWVFTPFVIVLSWIASLISQTIGGKPVPRSLASEEEILAMISLGRREGTVEDQEAKMLNRVFEFGDRPAREVMVPRPDVIAVEQGTLLKDFLAVYMEHTLSRYPVYRENMDNVIGTLSIKDVLMALGKGMSQDNTIDDLVRPAYFAPETKRIHELFRELQEKSYHMSIIVDEYGGTAGIVSLNRLIEEIVGEVGDELAVLEEDYQIINEYTFQVDGSMRVEEANEKMGLDLPEGDYETVAGFILSLLGHIPHNNEQLRYKGLKITITEMRGPKIEAVLITREAPVPKQLPAPVRK